MLITGKITIIRGFLYMIVQCVGALVGTAILKVSKLTKIIRFDDGIYEYFMSR